MRSQVDIITPEGIRFALPLAGPTRRVVAWAIDTFAIAAVLQIVQVFIFSLALISFDLAMALFVLSGFILFFGYSILLEWLWRGRTLGKWLMGIQVMDVEGLHLHFSQLVVRNLLRLIDALPAMYLVGGVSMLFSPTGQRLGDLAANTVVVVTRKSKQSDVARILPDKFNSLRSFPHLEARLRQRLDSQQMEVIIQSLIRRDSLDAQARVALYKELAEHCKTLVPFPDEVTRTMSDEQFLKNVVDSLYNRNPQRA